MAQVANLQEKIEPVSGRIYRTSRDESLLVLGVKPGSVFVEFADGSFRRMSESEWLQLNPNPSPC